MCPSLTKPVDSQSQFIDFALRVAWQLIRTIAARVRQEEADQSDTSTGSEPIDGEL